ncbi:O-antigen ligase family protein [Patescibacteria group bacterium]|nr:O-antigen ligase family protein [Patescibacteria group bacterium]
MTKITRWVVLGALFIIPFLPLFVANSFFFPFITGKNFAFRILVEIALAGWVLLTLIDARYRPRFSWTFVLFSALVVWMAIADAFAVNPAKAFWSNFERMDGFVTLIHYFAFFVVAGSVLSADKLWRKWWLAFLGGSLLVCLYSIFQVMGVYAIHQGGVRVDATFGNAEYLAAYLLFAIAISLWQAFESKRKWLRYGLFALTALELLVLYFTATRGAIIGLVGAAVLGAALWMFEAGKRGRTYAAVTLAALVILIGGFFLVRHTPWVEQNPTLGRFASISLSDGQTRFTIWHMAYEGFLQRPIVGWGQEGFNYVFNKYYQPSLYAQESWFDRAHDIFLDWLIAGGAPALLLFLALFVSSVIALYRNNVSRSERIILLSALAAYLFQGLFVFDNLFSYVPLAAIFAIAHAGSSRPFTRLQNMKSISELSFETIALPVTGVALLLVLWFVNVPGVRAARDLITAITPSPDINTNINGFKQSYADHSFGNQEITEQLVTFAESVVRNQTATVVDKQTVLTYAMQQMQAQVTKVPNDARLRLEYALGLRAGGDFADALTEIHLAEQLSPNKQSIYLEEGIESLQSGNPQGAHDAFNKAYMLDTSFKDLAAYAAAGDIVIKDVAGGKALLQKVYGTTIVDQDILLLAYFQIKDYPDFIATWRQRVVDQNNSVDAEFGLAAALANAGDLAGSRAEIQAAISQHPEATSQGTAMLNQLQQMAPK